MYVPGIPTGRNPHCTESSPQSDAVVIPCLECPLDGILTARLTLRLLIYFNLALQRHYTDKLNSQIKINDI